MPPANQKLSSETRKSQFTYELPKNCEIQCQFDFAGYMIIGVTSSGILKQIRIDIEKNAIIPVSENQIVI